MTEELTVGRLVNTHGIRGEIKVLSHTDFPDVRFAAGKKLQVIPADGSSKFEVTVESAREHKGMFIVKLKGYTNINEVEKYKGSLLKVPSNDLVDLLRTNTTSTKSSVVRYTRMKMKTNLSVRLQKSYSLVRMTYGLLSLQKDKTF